MTQQMSTKVGPTEAPRRRESTPKVALRAVGIVVGWGVIFGVALVCAYFVVGPHGHGPAASFDRSVAKAIARHRPVGSSGIAPVLPEVLCVAAGVAAAVAVLHRRWQQGDLGRIDLWAEPVRAGVALGLAAIGGYALSSTLKDVITRHRPPRALATTGDTGFSFPSSHSTVGLAIIVVCALVLGRYLAPRWRGVIAILAIIFGLLIPASRLAMGVHWFTDVAFGTVVGTLWGLLVWELAMRPAPEGRVPVGASGAAGRRQVHREVRR